MSGPNPTNPWAMNTGYNTPFEQAWNWGTGGLYNFFNPPGMNAPGAMAQMYQAQYGPPPPFQPPPLPDMSRGGGIPFAPSIIAANAPQAIPAPNIGTQWGGASQVPPNGIAALTQIAGTPARTHGGPAPTTPAAFGGTGTNPLAPFQAPFIGMANWQKNITNQLNAPGNGQLKTAPGQGGTQGGAANEIGAAGANKGAGTTKAPATFQAPLFDSNGQRADMYTDAQGNQRSMNKYVDVSYLWLDKNLGNGFTDAFIDRMKVDPIRFYMKAFQDDPKAGGFKLTGEPNEWLMGKAAQAAENDAKFQPGAVARWQELHGSNTPIPQEQWEKWWKMAQSGQYYDYEGRPYGVA